MDAKQLLLIQIQQTIAPPPPSPIFTAEVEYPADRWYKLKNKAEMTPDALALFASENLPAKEQAALMSGLDRARMDVESTCGLTLVVLFTRDFENNLKLDDLRFMDSVELTAFKMNNGKSKQ